MANMGLIAVITRKVFKLAVLCSECKRCALLECEIFEQPRK